MTLTNLIDLSGLSEFYTLLKANGANQIKYSESKTLKEAIDDAAKFEFTVITDFPNNPDTRHIYLKANNSGQTNNIYDEYIWTGNVFEKFGTTELNLSGYATTSSLAAVATSGSYTDLSNKPTIPAALVLSDWNASSGMGVILNKPTTLPTPVSAVSGSSVSQALTPNTHYVFGTVTSLTVTFGTTVSGVVNEYSFEFDSGSTAATITLPTSDMVWQDTPSCNANCHYEVNIKYNAKTGKYYGLWAEWEV